MHWANQSPASDQFAEIIEVRGGDGQPPYLVSIISSVSHQNDGMRIFDWHMLGPLCGWARVLGVPWSGRAVDFERVMVRWCGLVLGWMQYVIMDDYDYFSSMARIQSTLWTLLSLPFRCICTPSSPSIPSYGEAKDTINNLTALSFTAIQFCILMRPHCPTHYWRIGTSKAAKKCCYDLYYENTALSCRYLHSNPWSKALITA